MACQACHTWMVWGLIHGHFGSCLNIGALHGLFSRCNDTYDGQAVIVAWSWCYATSHMLDVCNIYLLPITYIYHSFQSKIGKFFDTWSIGDLLFRSVWICYGLCAQMIHLPYWISIKWATKWGLSAKQIGANTIIAWSKLQPNRKRYLFEN